jgi:TetR/AcrR family transcriptional repressor of nem operon
MSRAGLTHGGFYAHFRSKDELVAEAIGEMFREAGASFVARTRGMAPEAALAAYVDFYLSPAHRDLRDAGCPVPALAADLPRLSEPARARFDRGLATVLGWIAGLLAAAGRPDPEALASSAFAEMLGALSMARATPDPARSEAVLERSRRAVKARLGLEGGA